MDKWIELIKGFETIYLVCAGLAFLLLIVSILSLIMRRPKRRIIKSDGSLREGFSSSRKHFWEKVGTLLSRNKLESDELDEIEELLYGADLGPAITQELIGNLKNAKGEEFRPFFEKIIRQKMERVHTSIDERLFTPNKKELVTIMVVGINGAGKTTTIGKIATKLKDAGGKVIVGACDTFRAAAVDQLEVWCNRAQVEMTRAKEGTNPSGVAFAALKRAQEVDADYCILDTAGRLHTKANLMKELSKTKQVLKKLDPTAPTHTLLVLDAITGQNALRQAQEFNDELGLTGLVFTKCDGSSKAGSAIPIVDSLQLPIFYIGVGEEVADLKRFDLDEYLQALLDLD